MYEKLSNEELQFMEFFHDPVALLENLIPVNINAPTQWNIDSETIRIRNYQFAMLAYDYMYATDSSKSDKENFQTKKGAGDIYNISGRNEGKTFIGLVGDSLLCIALYPGDESCIASYDQKHVKEIAEKISIMVDNHKFFQIYHLSGNKKTVGRSPHRIHTAHGHLQIGVNEKVHGNNPGSDFHGKHYKRLEYDEFQDTSEIGTEKRIDSGSSLGYIERFFGIPDIRVGSPLGDILRDPKKKNWICRLPQYCIAEDSLVLMSDFTTKKIQDINIGDEIFSSTEFKPHKLVKAKVLNKIFNGYKNTVCIDNGFNQLYLTPDHKLLTKMSEFYRSWKSFNELKDNHQVYCFKNYIKNLNDYYEGVFLGFLETEGSFKRNNLEKSIGQKTEKLALEWLLKNLEIKYTKYDDKKIKDFSYFYLKRENNNYINSIYKKLEISKDCQLGFIAGCIYGDGCVHFNQKTNHRDITIIQKNKCEILENVLNLANIKFSKQKKSCNSNFGYFEGFSYIIGRYEVPLCLPFAKKSNTYKELTENNSLMSISHQKIHKVDSKIKKVYDLTTSSGTFVANGFIVHNCREDWDENQKQKQATEYGGENSLAYLLNVEARLIEGVFGKWDMERIRKNCYENSKIIKFFEIEKTLFKGLEEISNQIEKTRELDERLSKKLILTRLPSKKIIVASDIGTTGSPSEIIICFNDKNDHWIYEYQISLFKLIVKEQALVFKWIYDKLGTCFISLDCTNADGRAIRDELLSLGVPKDHMTDFRMNQNIEVDFQKDASGNIEFSKTRQPVMKIENTKEFAIQVLENIFYNSKLEIPHDDKFFREFAGFYENRTGNRPSWGSTTTEHLHDSFLLFALAVWDCEFKTNQNLKPRQRHLGSF